MQNFWRRPLVAREIIVQTLCDLCLAKDKKVDAREVRVTVGDSPGGHATVVALCGPHEAKVLTPLVEVLEAHGQLVDKEGNPTGPRGRYKKRKVGEEAVSCPGCGHISVNATALASHARASHNQTLAELRGDPRPYPCGTCDRTFSRPQGAAAHRRQVHGIAGKTSPKGGNQDEELDLAAAG